MAAARALVRWFWLLAAAGASTSGCRRARTPEVDAAPVPRVDSEVVSFPSGRITLQGVVYKPEGAGPFPAVLFNHGSGRGMTSDELFQVLGPRFVARGWVFFAPWRRGQGLSESAGPYIMDDIKGAWEKEGISAAAAVLVRRHETDQVDDQLAGLAWLRTAAFVAPGRVAVAGNSFGGIQTVLGVERADYCAGIDMAGGAQSWKLNPQLQAVMTRAVRNARAPIFFFQAENDYDVAPTRVLSAAMKQAGKRYQATIYPPSGKAPGEGHGLPLRGIAVWFDDAMGFLENNCR
jgi:dipeptidyl aminopeptidase/acylaminoacyl peptidase